MAKKKELSLDAQPSKHCGKKVIPSEKLQRSLRFLGAVFCTHSEGSS
uniref:Uncharacterized protein n=1 Tax=Anguilla anguilla TaxID=7936 RepID=A0A0E9Q4X6_ANGAN